MQKKNWILGSVAVLLLAALVLGILALTGVWKLGPEQVALCLRQGSGSPWSEYHDLLEQTLTGALAEKIDEANAIRDYILNN